jgi:hypothetical protein
MSINKNNTDSWKQDIAKSVDFYNEWFLAFAPKTFRETRIETTKEVEAALTKTNNLLSLTPKILLENSSILPMLRMSTCPPIARDRLIGLAYVSSSLVKSLESGKLPARMNEENLNEELVKICDIIQKLIDPDIFTWLENKSKPNSKDVERASTIIADRLCGSVADPIIRNAQEKRQLISIQTWLEERNYRKLDTREVKDFKDFPDGTFDFHFNVPVNLNNLTTVNIPIDIVIKPHKRKSTNFPILIEAKSAGDFTNVNKRRKEEAVKMSQLKNTYGNGIQFILFLCGYFDSGYLGYEAAEGIDWVWEHRINDFLKIGL